jgi:hypothetical protein
MSDDTLSVGELVDDPYWASTMNTTGPVGASGSLYGNITIASTVSNWGNYTINTAAGANGTWGTITGSAQPSLNVTGEAVFDGDIKWKGRSLGKLLEAIEDRLAIIQEPDPAKLEKFAALKKAYDHYKLMEKLIGNDWKDENK